MATPQRSTQLDLDLLPFGEAVWAFKPGDQVLIKVDPQKPEDSLFLGVA
jgi:hypothetical protein